MQTYYPTVYVPHLQKLTTIKGSETTVSVDWTGATGELETTLDGCTWVAGGAVTVGTPTLDASLASAMVSANVDGRGMVECQAFFADGQVRKQQIEFVVYPEIPQ